MFFFFSLRGLNMYITNIVYIVHVYYNSNSNSVRIDLINIEEFGLTIRSDSGCEARFQQGKLPFEGNITAWLLYSNNRSWNGSATPHFLKVCFSRF